MKEKQQQQTAASAAAFSFVVAHSAKRPAEDSGAESAQC